MGAVAPLVSPGAPRVGWDRKDVPRGSAALLKGLRESRKVGRTGRGETAEPRPSEHGEVPLTRKFMEQLFGALREDFATLKQEVAADIKDLKRKVADLGQHVDTLEQAHHAQRRNWTATGENL
ncbi:hypothetical protein NDU88_011539 [Pleurodeles waltl]|uniref:Uncharacterized protein n=1 Tax=Pleurodeles waltl TaxID=8319 RepID=A0AAV7S239_PLEWA|nr:hypothetical protein NDU88_011539 [Pleurodeles waltl]